MEPQEIAALLSTKTKPEVECLTAESVGVDHAVQRGVGEAKVLGVLEVVEHSKSVGVECLGGAGHRAAEEADGKGDVGARVGAAVEESFD